jgi:hypothetical protein
MKGGRVISETDGNCFVEDEIMLFVVVLLLPIVVPVIEVFVTPIEELP